MAEPLVDNEYLEIEEHPERCVVVLRRTSTPAPTEALIEAYQEAVGVMRPEHRQWGLVIDTSAAPGRNDPDFEDAIADVRHLAQRYFARMVVVVSTAVGELQVRRLNREDDRAARVTRDLDEALDWAAG